MADWSFHGWLSGVSTAADASSALSFSSASALAFGGGTRSTFQSNITLNTWSSSMHWAMDTSEASTDYCSDSHLWPIYPNSVNLDSDTGAIVDGVYVVMATGTPNPARGIGLRFTHNVNVRCNPVQLFAGTAPGAGNDPVGCQVAVVELTTTSPVWATVSVTSAKSLEVHATGSQEHWWTVGLAIKPLQVGHNGENVIKVQTTYF